MYQDQVFWAAIRRGPEGIEFVDINSLASLRDDAVRKSVVTDKDIPAWAKDNPVQRLILVRITEVAA